MVWNGKDPELEGNGLIGCSDGETAREVMAGMSEGLAKAEEQKKKLDVSFCTSIFFRRICFLMRSGPGLTTPSAAKLSVDTDKEK